jgi:hypothetical protein
LRVPPNRPALGVTRPPRLDAWYRHITLAPGEPADLQLSLLLTGVDNACDVFPNGRIGLLATVEFNP